MYHFAYTPQEERNMKIACDFEYYECFIAARVTPDGLSSMVLVDNVSCEIRNHNRDIIQGPESCAGGHEVLMEHLRYESDAFSYNCISAFASEMFGGGHPTGWSVVVCGQQLSNL